MRTGPFLSVALTLLSGACQPQAESFSEAQRAVLAAEVEETLGQLTEAMNSHDPDRVLGYFRNSEEFLYLGCTDFLMGWGTFSSRVGPYYASDSTRSFQQDIVRTQVLSPTVAVVALRGSSSEADALFWTEVLVKENGRWVIAHEHESWPGCSPPSEAHPFTTMEEMVGGTDTTTGEGGPGGKK